MSFLCLEIEKIMSLTFINCVTVYKLYGFYT